MNKANKRLGVLLPPGNVTMEIELPKYLEPGFTAHFTRLSREHSNISKNALLDMRNSMPRAADDLSHVAPDVVLYGCTSGSFVAGADGDRAINEEMTKITGVPAITTSTAVVQACRALGMKRIFMITPYPDSINETEVDFLAGEGIEVAGYDSFRLNHTLEYAEILSEDVAAMALSHREEIGGLDGLFISCTQVRAMDQIDRLEEVLGCPVICSNQASLWAMLHQLKPAGLTTRLPGMLGASTPAT